MKKIKSLIIALVLSINVLNINAQTVQTVSIIDTTFAAGFFAFNPTYYPTSYLSWDNWLNQYDTINGNSINSPLITYINPVNNITTFTINPTQYVAFNDTTGTGYDSINVKTILNLSNLQYLTYYNHLVITLCNGTTTYSVNLSNPSGTLFANDTIIINHTFKNCHSNKYVKLTISDLDMSTNVMVEVGNFKVTGYKTDSTTGIQSYNSSVSNLNAFPNPSNGQFTIKLDAKKSTADVIVYDLSGNVVYSNTEARLLGDNEISVNLNAAPGMYLIKADDKVFKMFITK